MDRETYDRYLEKFNARDYNGVLDYWADNFELKFAGVTIRNGEELLDFYSFLHSYIDESVEVKAFISDARMLCIEAVVHLRCNRDLPASEIERAGYPGLVAMTSGQVIELPQLIHYHLRDGKIVRGVCAVI